MNQPALISIITAIYNGERFLSTTLDSIRAQTFQDWECIIVDDGSTDGSRALADKYAALDSRIRPVTQVHAGLAAARNRGRAEMCASSKYATFMDSDDLWIPEALQTLLDELERHPEAVGAHGLGNYIDEHGQPKDEDFADIGRERLTYDGGSPSASALSEPTTFSVLAWTNRVFPPGVLLVRRSFYDKAGLFDSTFHQTDDWDMNVRLCRYGDLRFVNKVILSYRRHGANLSARNAKEMAQGLRVLQHKIFFSPENTEEHKRVLKKGWRALQTLDAQRKWKRAREKLAEGKVVEGGKLIAGLYVPLHRYLRGYPTRNGL
jgi:glycosyltransferase involved in cell wall biosynthesis